MLHNHRPACAPGQGRGAQAGRLAAGARLAAACSALSLLVEAQDLRRHIAAPCCCRSCCRSATRQLGCGACRRSLCRLASRRRAREEAKASTHIHSWGGSCSVAGPSREAAKACTRRADAITQGAVAAALALAIVSAGAAVRVALGQGEGVVGRQRAEGVKQIGCQLAFLLQHSRQAGATATAAHRHSVGCHGRDALCIARHTIHGRGARGCSCLWRGAQLSCQREAVEVCRAAHAGAGGGSRRGGGCMEQQCRGREGSLAMSIGGNSLCARVP